MSSERTLEGGVGIIGLVNKPQLNGMRGDILQYDQDKQRYQVKIRGSPSNSPVLLLKKQNLVSLLNDDDHAEDERHRQALLKKCERDESAYLQERVKALHLSDEIGYQLSYHSDRLADSVAKQVHVQIFEAYVRSQSLSYARPRTTSLIRSLEPFLHYEGVSGLIRISESMAFIMDPFRKAVLGEQAFDPSILFTAFCFCEDQLGRCNETLTVPINVAWTVFKLLSGEFQELLGPSIDEYLVKHGVQGLTWKDLQWCFAALHVQLSKDLRVGVASLQEVRSAEKTNQQMECCEAMLTSRPNSPHSYFTTCYFIQDTICFVPVRDRQARQVRAFQVATRGLEVAKQSGNPFYLHSMNLIVAYWMMTNGNDQPYTLGQVRNHYEQARRFKQECASYTNPFDFHRADQSSAHLKELLRRYSREQRIPDDAVLTEAVMVMDWEGGPGERIFQGERAERFDRMKNKYHCSNCGKFGQYFQVCSACGEVSYCSKTCQSAHWKSTHKKECSRKKVAK